jgi:predicted phosphodiesterase
MRVALFSDIHGNTGGLKAVLEQIDRRGGADVFVAAGDLLGSGPGAGETLDLLVDRGTRMIRGNWEEAIVDTERVVSKVAPESVAFLRESCRWARERLTSEHFELLRSLPLSLTLDLGTGKRLFVCHAMPDDPWAHVCAPGVPTDDLRQAFGSVDADVIAYGHFHQHFVQVLDGKLLVNVASVGLRSDGLSAWTLLEVVDGRVCVRQFQAPYDAGEESRLIRERGVPVP